MTYQRVVAIGLTLTFSAFLVGCYDANQGGFTIVTSEKLASGDNPPQYGPRLPLPYSPITGGYESDYTGTDLGTVQGNVYEYVASTDSTGTYFVTNGRSPAYWNHFVTYHSWCGSDNLYSVGILNTWTYAHLNVLTGSKSTAYEDCLIYSLPEASTRFAIRGQLPDSITLSSEAPLTTQYGMPLLYVYDGTSSVVATETATSVSSDGSQATFPFPSTLAQNGYSLALVNQISSSPGFAPAGTNLLSIASSKTIAGNPFGVAVGAQITTITCNSSKVSTDPDEPVPDKPSNGGGRQDCVSYQRYKTFSVVSLYAQNQVLIDGKAVDVGVNPTAVSTYSAGSTITTLATESETLSGATRAVVANSGSNTVSVLDLVKDARLYDVTVGNQPVALVVSSDGSTAYVANYNDRTVTQVNLNSGTATATIAVEGQPTSVAITSAGNLWVGGVGFLTEINTKTMNVVATEPITGKTIVALGFSNSVNELVATTVDTGGKVYADEISPSTFVAGGSYTPLASHTVSSVGTHLNLRAYTATLASANLINTNQVGAPPLVVQDGWAVVTATPTGFTITDITGHVVLVSETTPSPVTAIAVDSKLNVAYLVMPDSNILLTVPLPGTN
jgi:YVTN family beta-propeller protein